MHQHRRGKTIPSCGQKGQTLAQGVIAPLDTGGFSRLAGPQ
ncbi:MAG TPA: hypothetical protein VFA10_30560 [Ktedonobacteraceae bacterium]|nr:hypothetical protein [Ktedonobacteraceae bacterium]